MKLPSLVLINPNLVSQKNDIASSGIPYWPITLAYAAAALRQKGFPLRVIDAFGAKPKQITTWDNFYVQGLTPQEILNIKVKHREKFRPFAPVVCEDDALKYFDCDIPIPEPADFMLMVYPIKKQWQKEISAVTHVDGSGRLKKIRRSQNHLYYDLIKQFGKLSRIPILINTSFNIRGEPIVCTPYDAYKCMMGTGIDYLVIDKFLIRRDDNPKDKWNSEKYAND